MNSKINIFYACDDNFVKYTIISMKSMMMNASTKHDYVFHILHTNISDDMKQKVMDLQTEHFQIQFNDVTDYMKSINDQLPIRDYYTKTTYYRLFIAQMFPNLDKAIYIDSDTIVEGDISELYQYDLKHYLVGAANEQVMMQVDIYGQYVEKVLGIHRKNFFNAGILLINCAQFRKENVLEQFTSLLKAYNFVVTQDEDYLNLICHNKVLWLPQQWNTEVFGDIAYAEKDFKILHYIMVSKPWHFHDCRFKEHFWNYAKQTCVYEDVLCELENYTDEQRQSDIASGDQLLQTAINEISREDNFMKLLSAGKLHIA